MGIDKHIPIMAPPNAYRRISPNKIKVRILFFMPMASNMLNSYLRSAVIIKMVPNVPNTMIR
jgi:hypothetical protein